MITAARRLLIASSIALAAAACGGKSTAPSARSGATIAGTVRVNGAAAATPGRSARASRPTLIAPRAAVMAPRSAAAATAGSGLTVAIAATNLSAVVDDAGFFQIAGAPAGDIQLLFKGGSVNASTELTDVGEEDLVEIEVQVNGSSATIVSEARSTQKVSLCHNTGTGAYNLISVSVNAEPAHRAHGDGAPSGPVPGSPSQMFDAACQAVGPAVRIDKSTNGEDADQAPGPSIPVGEPVIWEYVVTNTGTVPLTNVVVTDDQDVTVSCPGSSLSVGQSITCTGEGVAVEGQYANVGMVTADSASGPISDTDSSHYFGESPDDGEPKVKLCHRTGTGRYVPIEVGVSAVPAHRAHGDGKVGDSVPGSTTGQVFGAGCVVN
jgi:hypothetical protein